MYRTHREEQGLSLALQPWGRTEMQEPSRALRVALRRGGGGGQVPESLMGWLSSLAAAAAASATLLIGRAQNVWVSSSCCLLLLSEVRTSAKFLALGASFSLK